MRIGPARLASGAEHSWRTSIDRVLRSEKNGPDSVLACSKSREVSCLEIMCVHFAAQ